MKAALLLVCLLVTAALSYTIFSPREEALASMSGFGTCFSDPACNGGQLGYRTYENCRDVYGKSWKEQNSGACFGY